MNCKPGDLAVIVAPFEPAGRGIFVTVVRAVSIGEAAIAKDGGLSRCDGSSGPAWMCDAHDERFPLVVADVALRPIRAGGITDDAVRELYAPKQPEIA